MIKSGTRIRKNNWWISGIIAGLWGGWNFIQDFDPTNIKYQTWFPVVLDAIKSLQGNSGYILILTIVLWCIWSIVVVNDKNWVLIDQLLNLTREKVFKHCKGEPKEHHQVTLFIYKKRLLKIGFIRQSIINTMPDKLKEYFPRSIITDKNREAQGWLVPIRRAGFSGRNGGAIFALSDITADNEGICGQSWISSEIKQSLDLPRVTKSVGDKPIADYAIKGYCTEEYIRKKIRKCGASYGKNTCILPRSIVAFPIGEIGLSEAPKYILVFDSRNKEGIPKEIRDDYSVVNDMLGSLLSGV
ncbi:hypothetical protein ACU6U9_02730 [Pseudomonas sp. HK3]